MAISSRSLGRSGAAAARRSAVGALRAAVEADAVGAAAAGASAAGAVWAWAEAEKVAALSRPAARIAIRIRRVS